MFVFVFHEYKKGNSVTRTLTLVKQLFGKKAVFLHCTMYRQYAVSFQKKIASCSKQFVKHFENLVRHFYHNH
jgi:hypothetical protein